jgi:hypothetical protein
MGLGPKRLTSQQRLKVATLLGEGKLLRPAPECLTPLITSSYEELAVRFFATLQPSVIESLPCNDQTKFLVRAFYPAALARMLLGAFAGVKLERAFCLLGPALDLIAFERTFLEMLTAGALKGRSSDEQSLVLRLPASIPGVSDPEAEGAAAHLADGNARFRAPGPEEGDRSVPC